MPSIVSLIRLFFGSSATKYIAIGMEAITPLAIPKALSFDFFFAACLT